MSVYYKRMKNGFGLIELMIAITLSLIMGAAVIQIYLASKNTYRFQDALSSIQENGRFAIAVMTQDVRMAGFLGCANLDAVLPTNIVQGITSAATDINAAVYTPSTVIMGFDNVAAGSYGAVAGTDVLIIRKASNTGAHLVSDMTASNASFQVTDDAGLGFKTGDVMLITDCQSAHLFVASNVTGTGPFTIAHDTSKNTSGQFTYQAIGKSYLAQNSEVLAYGSVTYTVRDTGRKTPSNKPIYSLYVTIRQAGQGGPSAVDPTYTTELVEGVEDMQLAYGVDSSADGLVDRADIYKTANNVTDWSKVVSVRINLLMQGTDDNIVGQTGLQTQNLTFPADSLVGTPSAVTKDGRLRQVFYAVAGVRNRLP